MSGKVDPMLEVSLEDALARTSKAARACEKAHAALRNHETRYARAVASLATAHRAAAEVYRNALTAARLAGQPSLDGPLAASLNEGGRHG